MKERKPKKIKKVTFKEDPRTKRKRCGIWLQVLAATLLGFIVYAVLYMRSSEDVDLLSEGVSSATGSGNATPILALLKAAEQVKAHALFSPKSKFADDCMRRATPIVLRNSATELWPARKKWTPEYLESKVKTLTGIYENTNRWFGPYYDQKKPLSRFSERLNPYRADLSMAGKDFFSRIQSPRPGKYLYFTGDISQLGEWAVDDIQPQRELLILNPRRSSVNTWIGQPNVVTHCHYDGYHNFYAQLYGRKRFTLFKPTEWPGLYPYPFLHPNHAQAQVNLSSPNAVESKLFPLVGRVEAVEASLEPGDLLYIPPLWFHHVESLSVSISVNVWTDSKQTETVERLFSLPLPTKKWPNSRTLAVATALLIDNLLTSVCSQQNCASEEDVSKDTAPPSDGPERRRHFINQLWKTRYEPLMEEGKLPRALTMGKAILCEKDASLAKMVRPALKDIDYTSFTSEAGSLVALLPADTWELWMGNYIEYIAATAVDVQYVGPFLKYMETCTA